MDYLRELVSECYELKTEAVLTEEELDYIDECVRLIAALEISSMVESNEEEEEEKINNEDIKSGFIKAISSLILKINKSPKLMSNIVNKAKELKQNGVTSVTELYNDIMKDKEFLKPFINESTEFFKPISKTVTLGTLPMIVAGTSAVAVILLLTVNPLNALRIIITKLLPLALGFVGAAAATGVALGALSVAIMGGIKGKQLGFKNILKDFTSVLKQLKIKAFKKQVEEVPKTKV
jgi:hypothetical protein